MQKSWKEWRLLVLLGTTLVFSSLHSGQAFAQPVWQHLIGAWTNDATGETIEVRPNADAILSDLGQGRIADTFSHAANLVVTGRQFECYYYVSFVSGFRTNWRLTAGDKSQCHSGIFSKSDGSGSVNVPPSNQGARPVSPSDVQDNQTANALKMITETANQICQTAPVEQTSEGLQLSGEAQAKLGGLTAKLAELGVTGSGQYQSGKSTGVLQKDLITAIQSGNDCKREVFRTLEQDLIRRHQGSENSNLVPPSTPDGRGDDPGQPKDEFIAGPGKAVLLTRDSIAFSATRYPCGGRSDLICIKIGEKTAHLGVGSSVEFPYSQGSCSITVLELLRDNSGRFLLKC